MFKYMLLFIIVGLAYSTPVPDPKPIIPIKTSQTPASTEKLVQLVSPSLPALAAIPQVALPLAIAPLAYTGLHAYVAPFNIAAIHPILTGDAHGYKIIQ